MPTIRRLFALPVLLLAAACGPTPSGSPDAASPAGDGQGNESTAFTRIAPGETVRFTGTEPFWGGRVAFTTLSYSTPENPDGETIAVERFAGLGGVSWTGEYAGAPFTLAVTPGACNDGMSDRTYPYVATLDVRGEQRSGCAWTERDTFTGPPNGE